MRGPGTHRREGDTTRGRSESDTDPAVSTDVETRARSWDPPGLPPRRTGERCRYHYGLCAYRDDDPARCPLCHCSWLVVLRSGWHSCEHSWVWGPEVCRERIALARELRLSAALRADGTAWGPPVDQTPAGGLSSAQSTEGVTG